MNCSDGYCLQDPSGCLLRSTFGFDREEVWGLGFEMVASTREPEWRDRYWKRWTPSLRAAKRLGWKIVPVKIMKVQEVKR